MFIHSLAVEGFASLPSFEARDLSRAVRVCGDPAAGVALANAITLGLSAFSVEDTRQSAAQIGLGEALTVTGQRFPEEIHVEQPALASLLVAPTREGVPPCLKVSMELVLDPPQFGALRLHAQRDPRLVPALAEKGATVRVSVGWAFTNDFSLVTASLLAVRVGGLDLPPEGKECPPWLPGFLAGFAGRFHRRRPMEFDVAAFARDERHADLERRVGVEEARASLRGAPHRLGNLELVESDSGEVFAAFAQKDGQLVPLQALGPRVLESVGLAQAVFAHPAEILLLEAPTALAPRPRSRLTWLHAQAEADGSPLEQVWLFGTEGAGALDLAPVDLEPHPA
jgi:hypothetical protein